MRRTGTALVVGWGEPMLPTYPRPPAGSTTGHTRPAEPAVPVGVLGQVLLVVILGVIERPGRGDLGRDLAVAGVGQRLVVGVARRPGGSRLLVGEGVDSRPVLRADVVALAHPLRRVVRLPEDLEHVFVARPGGVEDHEDRLGVPGPPRADLL